MIEKTMLSPKEVAAVLGIGLTRTYGLLMSGAIGSVKIGKSRKVPRLALERYVKRLEREAGILEDAA